MLVVKVLLGKTTLFTTLFRFSLQIKLSIEQEILRDLDRDEQRYSRRGQGREAVPRTDRMDVTVPVSASNNSLPYVDVEGVQAPEYKPAKSELEEEVEVVPKKNTREVMV